MKPKQLPSVSCKLQYKDTATFGLEQSMADSHCGAQRYLQAMQHDA